MEIIKKNLHHILILALTLILGTPALLNFSFSSRGFEVGGLFDTDSFLQIGIARHIDQLPPKDPFRANEDLFYQYGMHIWIKVIQLILRVDTIRIFQYLPLFYIALLGYLIYFSLVKKSKKIAMLSVLFILFSGGFGAIITGLRIQNFNTNKLLNNKAELFYWNGIQLKDINAFVIGESLIFPMPQSLAFIMPFLIFLLLDSFWAPAFAAFFFIHMVFAINFAFPLTIYGFYIFWKKRDLSVFKNLLIAGMLILPSILPSVLSLENSGGKISELVGLNLGIIMQHLRTLIEGTVSLGFVFLFGIYGFFSRKTDFWTFFFIGILICGAFFFVDYGKIFYALSIPICIFSAEQISKLDKKVIGAIILISIISPTAYLLLTYKLTGKDLISTQELSSFAWLDENYKNSMVLNYQYYYMGPYNFIPVFSDQHSLSGGADWGQRFGMEDSRNKEIEKMFCGDKQLLQKFSVSTVYLGPKERQNYPCINVSGEKLFSNGNFEIFSAKPYT